MNDSIRDSLWFLAFIALGVAILWEMDFERKERRREHVQLREEIKGVLDEHLLHQDIRHRQLLVAGEN